jgi:hypothetical protein
MKRLLILVVIGIVLSLSGYAAVYGSGHYGRGYYGIGEQQGTNQLGGGGGGSSPPADSSFSTTGRCHTYTQAYQTCFYYEESIHACVRGCPNGNTCVNFACTYVPPVEEPLLSFSFVDKISLYVKDLFEPNQIIDLEKIMGSNSTNQDPKTPIEKVIYNPFLLFLIAGLILLVIAAWTFGVSYVFGNPAALITIALSGLVVFLIIYLKLFG